MKRLTHERCNGIKTGYWSPEKKDELVKALAAYENTGLTPDQIQELKERDTPKEPEQFDGHWYKCPSCGKYVGGLKGNFCHMCGQRLKRRED